MSVFHYGFHSQQNFQDPCRRPPRAFVGVPKIAKNSVIAYLQSFSIIHFKQQWTYDFMQSSNLVMLFSISIDIYMHCFFIVRSGFFIIILCEMHLSDLLIRRWCIRMWMTKNLFFNLKSRFNAFQSLVDLTKRLQCRSNICETICILWEVFIRIVRFQMTQGVLGIIPVSSLRNQ